MTLTDYMGAKNHLRQHVQTYRVLLCYVIVIYLHIYLILLSCSYFKHYKI